MAGCPPAVVVFLHLHWVRAHTERKRRRQINQYYAVYVCVSLGPAMIWVFFSSSRDPANQGFLLPYTGSPTPRTWAIHRHSRLKNC